MIPLIKVSMPLFGGDPVVALDRNFYKRRLTDQRKAVRAALDQFRQLDAAITRNIESGAEEAAEDARNASQIRRTA